MVCRYRLRRRNGGMGAIDYQGAVMSVKLSAEAEQKSIAISLLERDIELKDHLAHRHQMLTRERSYIEQRLRSVLDRIDRQKQILEIVG